VETFKVVYRELIQDNVYQFFHNRRGFVEDMTKNFHVFVFRLTVYVTTRLY